MRAQEFITERKAASIRGQIQDAVRQHGGDPKDYFVRFTEVDKIGFSDRQKFKRHVEIDDPSFTVSSIGTSSRGGGRRALWFYPLRTYLGMMSQGEYAMDFPYVWLVKKRPDAWLQPIGHRDPREVKAAPEGQRRVGILKGGLTPQAVFFEPAFDVVGRYYDYAGQHRRHGEVKGKPEPTFFDRVRGTLNEIGDQPSEYEPNRRRRRSLFHATVDGQWVDVFFDRSPINDSLQITFTVNQTYEAPPRPTRASGSVIRILSTVLKIVREQLPKYMKSARPPRVTFTAKGASRIELYKRYFVPVIQDILGDRWQLEIVPGDMTVFVWEPKRSGITEVQRGVMDILRDELPGWPDYVLKDMVITKIKSPQDLEMKLDHVRELATMADQWRLVQQMPLTFDMLDPTTRYRMKIKRDFGNKNPFMIPRDRERFEHALELVKAKRMENLPPIIMLKTAKGLELWEGWHRTMAAFRLHPEGFLVNAWIGSGGVDQ